MFKLKNVDDAFDILFKTMTNFKITIKHRQDDLSNIFDEYKEIKINKRKTAMENGIVNEENGNISRSPKKNHRKIKSLPINIPLKIELVLPNKEELEGFNKLDFTFLNPNIIFLEVANDGKTIKRVKMSFNYIGVKAIENIKETGKYYYTIKIDNIGEKSNIFLELV